MSVYCFFAMFHLFADLTFLSNSHHLKRTNIETTTSRIQMVPHLTIILVLIVAMPKFRKKMSDKSPRNDHLKSFSGHNRNEAWSLV